jgi:phosphoglycolate phosphatase-like HAD superfamily hydrolase
VSRVLLFDIDNTLLYSGGAGSVAMSAVFEEMFGIPNGFHGIEFSGRTDLYILYEGLKAHGIEGDPQDHLQPFLDRYYALLPKTLAEKRGELKPGFPELLGALQEGATLGIATGNFSGAARLKLEHYEIAGYFKGGGYGEVSIDRAEVVRQAIDSVVDGHSLDDVLVIGDTPHDITSALANGVRAVGVATGTNTVDELRESGAHLVFESFEDWRSAAATLLAPGLSLRSA